MRYTALSVGCFLCILIFFLAHVGLNLALFRVLFWRPFHYGFGRDGQGRCRYDPDSMDTRRLEDQNLISNAQLRSPILPS
jgi:hypothetical protein